MQDNNHVPRNSNVCQYGSCGEAVYMFLIENYSPSIKPRNSTQSVISLWKAASYPRCLEEPRCSGKGSPHSLECRSWEGSPGCICSGTQWPWELLHKDVKSTTSKCMIYSNSWSRLHFNAPSQPGWRVGFSNLPGTAAKGIPLKTSMRRRNPRRMLSPSTMPPSVYTAPSYKIFSQSWC